MYSTVKYSKILENKLFILNGPRCGPRPHDHCRSQYNARITGLYSSLNTMKFNETYSIKTSLFSPDIFIFSPVRLLCIFLWRLQTLLDTLSCLTAERRTLHWHCLSAWGQDGIQWPQLWGELFYIIIAETLLELHRMTGNNLGIT